LISTNFTFANSLFSLDDIVDLIETGGLIRVKNIKNLPDHNESDIVKPISVDDDGLITISTNSGEFEVEVNNVIEILN
jgi:hypothetical protein